MNGYLIRRVVPMFALQAFDVEVLCSRTIPWYRTLTETYLDQRPLVPAGHLVEVGFKELEESPIATLRHVYGQLNLPAFEVVEPAVEKYLESLDGYRKNSYAEIDSDTRTVLAREWKRSFDEWGYDAH